MYSNGSDCQFTENPVETRQMKMILRKTQFNKFEYHAAPLMMLFIY